MPETPEYRSKMMSKIRSTGGKTETKLAKALWHCGIRYFRNYKKLPGKPDIAITKYKIAIFVDGEFWHGYDWENEKRKRLHNNREYWINKIEKNMQRDVEVNKSLRQMGWIVLRFWEKHELQKNFNKCVSLILQTIEAKQDKKTKLPNLDRDIT
ncbi:very short patch repair endonuclease [Enterococcus hirae]|nr:very short patch repair endonuclease [Enterococcus hirae]